MVIATFSLFVTVTILAALLVPTATCPKARLAGVRLTGSTPVPLTETTWGLLAALSVMVMVPLCAPATVGANVTIIEHCVLAARVVPQLLVWVNGAPLATMLMPVSATVI